MPMSTKDAQLEYQRRWIAQRRAEWFAEKFCVDCGSCEDLELDHVDPAQKVTHRVWSWAQERREAELAKCVVRCAPCHRLKTTLEGPQARHGTKRMHDHYGCRCAECKEAKRAANARHRAKVKAAKVAKAQSGEAPL